MDVRYSNVKSLLEELSFQIGELASNGVNPDDYTDELERLWELGNEVSETFQMELEKFEVKDDEEEAA